MTILSCGPGQVRHLPFPLKPPTAWRWGWFTLIPEWLPSLAVTSLEGGGGPSGLGSDHPSIFTTFHPPGCLGVARMAPQATRGQGMRGNPSWGCCLLPGSCVSTPRNTHPASHAHLRPSQVLEKKESLFQIPNQITARYAHSWPGGDFLSLLQWHLIFFFPNGHMEDLTKDAPKINSSMKC